LITRSATQLFSARVRYRDRTLSAAGLSEVKRHLEVGVFSEYQATKKGPVQANQLGTELKICPAKF